MAYNEQTDAAYDNMLLLNIIRSSYRMPTQYMDISSIVGSNSATAGATFNGAPSPTGAATAGFSYNSTFTAPVLSTKEFYQGILSPTSPETVSYYFQTSRPLELVFNLMFDRITVRRSDGECASRATLGRCVVSLTNDPRNPLNFVLFETMMKYLLMNGFSTEQVSVKKGNDRIDSGKVSTRFLPAMRSRRRSRAEGMPRRSAIASTLDQERSDPSYPIRCYFATTSQRRRSTGRRSARLRTP